VLEPLVGAPNARLFLSIAISLTVHATLLLVPSFPNGLKSAEFAAKSSNLRIELVKNSSLSHPSQEERPQSSEAPTPIEREQLEPPIDHASLVFPYYSSAQLTKQPVLFGELELEPLEGFSPDAHGRIRLMLFIAADGQIDRVITVHSDLPNYPTETIMNRILAAHFAPGKIDSNAVASFVEVEIIVKAE